MVALTEIMTTYPNNPEFTNFTDALRSILAVSKVEFSAREEEWKKEQTVAKKRREEAKARRAKARAARAAALASKKS
jgi:hypothetical protein